MNTKAKIGRPSFTLKFPVGPFTLNELYDLNHQRKYGRGKAKVCKLTVIKHVDRLKASRYVRKLKETVQTGKVGKPAYKFELTARGLAKFGGGTPEVSVEAPAPSFNPNVDPMELAISAGAPPSQSAVMEPSSPAPVSVVEATLAALPVMV